LSPPDPTLFVHLETADAYVFTDAARTTPANAGDPVGGWTDLTGNGYHATQTGSARPTYQSTPNRLTIDKTNDRLIVTVPTGGWVGTLVMGTDQGTASYDVSIPAGSYDIGGAAGGLFFPGTAIVGGVKISDVMTAAQKTAAEAAMVALGATASYGAVTNFANYWRRRDEITSFPSIDTSSGTNFAFAWYGCSSLTSFPVVDVSGSITFNSTWRACLALETFPANMFDTITVGDFNNAFRSTNLSQTSIDNILVSIDTAGITSGTRTFFQSGGSAPSATGEAAIDSMRADGWTVTVTGGY